MFATLGICLSLLLVVAFSRASTGEKEDLGVSRHENEQGKSVNLVNVFDAKQLAADKADQDFGKLTSNRDSSMHSHHIRHMHGRHIRHMHKHNIRHMHKHNIRHMHKRETDQSPLYPGILQQQPPVGTTLHVEQPSGLQTQMASVAQLPQRESSVRQQLASQELLSNPEFLEFPPRLHLLARIPKIQLLRRWAEQQLTTLGEEELTSGTTPHDGNQTDVHGPNHPQSHDEPVHKEVSSRTSSQGNGSPPPPEKEDHSGPHKDIQTDVHGPNHPLPEDNPVFNQVSSFIFSQNSGLPSPGKKDHAEVFPVGTENDPKFIKPSHSDVYFTEDEEKEDDETSG